MREFAGDTQTQTGGQITTGAPTGAVGIDMTLFNGTSRALQWLVSITVDATTDIFVYGALAQGQIDTASDDIWGTHQDRYGIAADGKIGSALAAGTHHRVIDNLGVYSRVGFSKSNGSANVTIRLTELLETHKGA